jgi:hypothetical protein
LIHSALALATSSVEVAHNTDLRQISRLSRPTCPQVGVSSAKLIHSALALTTSLDEVADNADLKQISLLSRPTCPQVGFLLQG